MINVIILQMAVHSNPGGGGGGGTPIWTPYEMDGDARQKFWI